MKYNDEDFENYLNGQMPEIQKIEFEKLLISSSVLKNDFDRYKKLKELIRNTKSIKLNEDYSSTILYRFRNNLQDDKKAKPFYNIGAFAAAVASIMLGFILTVNLFIKNDVNKNSDFQTIVENEKDSIINSFDISDRLISNADSESIQRIDSVYNDLLFQNINAESDLNNFYAVTSDIENIDLEQFISDEKIDQIYAQLIEKEF